MTARIQSEDLRKIIPSDALAAGEDLSSYIQSAHLFVKEELISTGLSEDRLTQIELYLAAHFAIITLEKGGLTRQKIGESEDFFQGWTNTSVGLNATRYGQQAVMLDTSGNLAALARGTLRAKFSVIGSPPSSTN